MRFHKINYLLIIFFLFILYSSLFSNTITIESDGFAILSSNLNLSRKNALNDAILKGIKKFLKDRNINPEKEIIDKIKNYAVSGFEILKENVEGNILREKINLMLDENSINDIIEAKIKVPYNVIIFAKLNGKENEDLFNFIKKILIDEFGYNFTFLNYKDSQDYDIGILLNIKIIQIKRLISINKIFFKLTGNLLIYNRKNVIIDNSTFSRDLTLSDKNEYFKYLPTIIKPLLKKYLPIAISQLPKKKITNQKIIYFSLIKPENYSIIEKIKNIFNEFNLNYSIIEIYKGNITFKITGISENELIKILQSKNFTQNFKIFSKGG